MVSGRTEKKVGELRYSKELAGEDLANLRALLSENGFELNLDPIQYNAELMKVVED